MPCAHGIYPFTDATVGDFDPIFGELVARSGDQRDILYQPDECAKPFLPVGERLARMAAQAEEQGESANARDLYLRAAAVYRIARFPIISLLASGVLDHPSCKLLVINGMEDSIFPIEDSLIVATRGDKKDLILRGNRGHMGNPGAEDILYQWIDNAASGKP